MFDEQDFNSFIDATVYDRDGEKVGRVGQLFLDEETGAPSWVSVHTGLFGLSESLVPIDESTTVVDGRIDVPYEKAVIKDAPRVDTDTVLDEADEERLYGHYGRAYSPVGGDVDQAHRLGDDDGRLDDRDVRVDDRIAYGDETDLRVQEDLDLQAAERDRQVAENVRADGVLSGDRAADGWTEGRDARVSDTDDWSPGHENRNPGDVVDDRVRTGDVVDDGSAFRGDVKDYGREHIGDDRPLDERVGIEDSIDERRRRLRRYNRPAL